MSLRDVERAMIVFQFFYGKMDLFAPLINTKAEEEHQINKEVQCKTTCMFILISHAKFFSL